MARPSLLGKELTSVFDKRTATALATLDLTTVGRLVYHFPRRYLAHQQLSSLTQGETGDHITVVAEVVSSRIQPTKQPRLKLLRVVISDGRNELELAFFGREHTLHFWQKQLTAGTRAMFDGKWGEFRGKRQLVNPRFEQLDPLEDVELSAAARLLPIYPAGAKAASWLIARSVQTVLPLLDARDLADPLPAALIAARQWPDLLRALQVKHAPDSMDDLRLADDRLRFEEAFVLQTALARRRAQSAALPATARAGAEGGLLAAFDATLPFSLTEGQQRVGAEIATDLAREHPMHRLLQGEVGSGKTIVALRAMLTVVDAGGQAALLAPTEVLAVQHYRGISTMMGSLASAGMLPLAGPVHDGVATTRVALLTGSQGARARRDALAAAASGEAGIVIGTHALLQEGVEFADLGLIVVDEQQRFGVEQRDALRAKSLRTPHLLVMTATPIPRTVAMTTFGDLDTSTLRELPRGRQPVASHVVPQDRPAWMQRTWHLVRSEVDAGRQAFVVCPAIDATGPGEDVPRPDPDRPDEAGKRPLTTVTAMLERLSDEPALDGLRFGVLHGRLPAEEKDAVMSAFAAHRLDVLIATTVIEVGVDVPNASVMVVMDANRFGVSQLHQLRGRIGRGAHSGYCFFVVPEGTGPAGFTVLEQLAATSDGFDVARIDLEQRREGDVLGTAQSGGLSSLRLLRVTEHEDVILSARELANEVIEADPDLTAHPDLRIAIDSLLHPEREVFLERG